MDSNYFDLKFVFFRLKESHSGHANSNDLHSDLIFFLYMVLNSDHLDSNDFYFDWYLVYFFFRREPRSGDAAIPRILAAAMLGWVCNGLSTPRKTANERCIITL